MSALITVLFESFPFYGLVNEKPEAVIALSECCYNNTYAVSELEALRSRTGKKQRTWWMRC
jgi:hypothetical protein